MKTTLTLLLIMELCGLSSGLIKRHFFVKKEMTWDSAHSYCNVFFHDLSTFINELEQQQFLQDAANQTSNAWVGLHTELGVWRWSGGQTATEILWDTNQPDTSDGCVFLHIDRKKLHDKDCTVQFAAFCMTNFVLVPQKETWEGALEYCKTYYIELATLSTVQRMNSALMEISQAETEYVWIGLRFLEGDWLWVNRNHLYYTAWYQNEQPQCPAGDLRCGALDKKTKLWTNRNCEEKLSFICLFH
ncbi:secretory phospholipase A2 receptor-like [Puntigrus tetrazona]|uniref:secretory phospholipase A2 receptor-like n=1 Tax=Puntigrus tetrazona TaxID=1606681 RepID=UPI001C8A4533|nr:secretory phospholipase A2 receptor-like [Puntigrus tetrazona]